MEAEEGGRVPERELHRGVDRHHVRRHPGEVRPGLNHELIEHHALQQEPFTNKDEKKTDHIEGWTEYQGKREIIAQSKHTHLHGDAGLLGPTRPPQNQSEEGEHHEEPQHEHHRVAPARHPTGPAALPVIEQPLLLDRIEPLASPGPPAPLLAGVGLPVSRLEGARVSGGGGGAAGWRAEGGVVGGVGRGARGAEQRGRGVEGVGGLLPVVRGGVPGGALDVVRRLGAALRGAAGRGRGEAAHLRVGLRLVGRHRSFS